MLGLSGNSAVFLLFLMIPLSLFAQQNDDGTSVYKFQSKEGVTSFSDIEPMDLYFETVRIGCFACHVNSQVDWFNTKLFKHQYQEEINYAARLHDVDPDLIRAIIHAESHFRKDVVSKQGAQGLMQLMPATAHELGVKDPFVAEQNIQGGAKHLAKLFRKYRGDIRMIAAAYNSGEGTVEKYGGVPPYKETKVYIERVEILHKRYQKENA